MSSGEVSELAHGWINDWHNRWNVFENQSLNADPNFRVTADQIKAKDVLGPDWPYVIPLWWVIIFSLAMLVIPMEIGVRRGARRRRLHPETQETARNDITLTSMLALLGLMLALTCSFGMSRADMRKQALITEINAISTA